MDTGSIPLSHFVGASARENVIAGHITTIIGKTKISHFSPIAGMAQSGRIFMTEDHPDCAALPEPVDSDELAAELMRFIPEARYALRRHPAQEKGWEIRHCVMHGNIALIAWATWVHPA